MEPWLVRKALRDFIEQNEGGDKARTSKQNSALHVDCQLIADKLNDAGLDQRAVLKPGIEIPWTMKAVKEMIWRPFMKALYHKESTTELNKQQEIEHIHAVIMRELGEKHGIEWHEFPSKHQQHE